VLDWNAEVRTRLRTRLDEHRLRLACIVGYMNFTADLENGDIPHREMQIRHVQDLADMAAALGGNLVRVFTGYQSPHSTPHAQWNTTVDALRECARRPLCVAIYESARRVKESFWICCKC
jgi:sugar phosphate isomerase/epimerase